MTGHQLFDTPPEENFDRLTRLAARLLAAPVSLLSLVDDRRQFFKSIHGLTGWAAEVRGTPLSHSFCQHVVRRGAPLVVEDAQAHPLVRESLAIPDLGVVAYLGAPVRNAEGMPLGALCAIDGVPRRWRAEDRETLETLARAVEAEIALRETVARQAEALRALGESQAALAQARDAAGPTAAPRMADAAGASPDPPPPCMLAERFFDASAEPCIVADAEGRLQRVNRAFAALMGESEAAVAGRPHTDFVHPDDLEAARAALRGVRRRETVTRVVTRLRRRDGTWVWSEWAARAASEDGLVFATLRDVTADLRAADRREAVEAASGVGGWDIDPVTRAMRWSDTAFAVCGAPAGETRSSLGDLLARIPIAARPEAARAFERLIRNGAAFDIETRLIAGAAGEREVRLTGTAERRGGNVARVFGSIEDVTEARAARRHADRLAAVAANTGNMVIVCDAEGRIDWVNPTFEARTGYSLAEARGRRSGEVMASDGTDPETVAALCAARLAGRPMTCEIRKCGKRGEPFWVHVDLRPLHEGGVFVGSISIETDITEAKAAQARLAEAETRERAARDTLMAAIEALPDGFVLYDSDDRLVLCNDRYREIYPRSAPFMTPGVRFEDLIRAGAARGEYVEAVGREEAWVAERLAARRASRDGFEQELADGRWLRIVERRTRDGGYVGLRVDVSPIKQAERRLADTIVAAGGGAWEWNVQTHETRVSDSWAEMLGYTLDEFQPISMNAFGALLHPDDGEAARSRLDACLRGETEIYECESRMRHKDGRWISIFSRGRVVSRTPEGAPEWMFGIHLDMTERRRLQSQLEAERDLFQTLMATSPQGIVALDARGAVLFANAAAADTLGCPGETIGADGFVNPALAAETLEGAPFPVSELPGSRVLATGAPASNERIAVRTASGERRILSVRAAPVATPSAAARVVIAAQDVTEKVAVEAALRDALRRAEAASAAKSEFLSVISHEMRTPLNGVLGMTDLLERAISAPQQRRMLGIIRESGRALLVMIGDVLDFLMLETEPQALDPTPFDPGDLARRAADELAPAAERRGLAFTLCVGAVTTRIGDAGRILQILRNLVSNATKFTEAGAISVSVTAAAGEPVVFEVRDTGVGMSESARAALFEPFAQADASSTRRHGGIGIGMAIVKRLVDAMEGDIAVDSAPGAGARIRVALPLPQARDERITAEDRALRGLRVLVVGAQQAECLFLRALLARLDATAINSDGGGAATARADILLIDVSTSGAGTLAAFREQEKIAGAAPTPAIAVVAEPPPDGAGVPGGFDAYVVKPVTLDMLAEALARAQAARRLGSRSGE